MPGANNEYWRQEEFDTVGIDHIRDDGSYADAANWYFTENTIRANKVFIGGRNMRKKIIIFCVIICILSISCISIFIHIPNQLN